MDFKKNESWSYRMLNFGIFFFKGICLSRTLSYNLFKIYLLNFKIFNFTIFFMIEISISILKEINIFLPQFF